MYNESHTNTGKESKMKDQYRFDNAYSSVYEYNNEQQAYIYIGSYLQYGIKSNMRDTTKIRLVTESWKDQA